MSEDKSDFRPSDRWLMFAFALAPMAVLTHLTVSYALVPESCAQNSKAMLHLSSAFFFGLAMSAMAIGRHYHRLAPPRAVSPGSSEEHPEHLDVAPERMRWLSMVVMVLSVFSAMVIVAMELANVILRSCD